MTLDLAPYLAQGMVIVTLELEDAAGNVVSQNLYWLGAKPSSYRELNSLAPTLLKIAATSGTTGDVAKVKVQLTNTGSVVSLANKLTLIAAKDKTRILPAYFSDNYISLLPGESRSVEIDYPAGTVQGGAEIAVRGWNATPQTVPVRSLK
jgi:hypothetical protein